MLCPDETVRQVGSAWEILAPAKLNLYLEVLGPRADGFHDLETLMVPVRVYDQLRWRDSDRLELRVSNLLARGNRSAVSLGEVDNNLVLRAARLLAEVAGIEPHGRFDLFKRIPVQAGMGGGSSDAAAALVLANAAWGTQLTYEQLQPLAAQLGSDVPFFLNQGAAICRGRGELIEPLKRMPRLHFVVVQPATGLSTAKVFGRLSARGENTENLAKASDSRLSQLVSRLSAGDIAAAGQRMTNRLEEAAAQIAPWLETLRNAFAGAGFLAHFMTGSGSAYIGVAHSSTQAQSLAQRLKSMNLGHVFATATC